MGVGYRPGAWGGLIAPPRLCHVQRVLLIPTTLSHIYHLLLNVFHAPALARALAALALALALALPCPCPCCPIVRLHLRLFYFFKMIRRQLIYWVILISLIVQRSSHSDWEESVCP